MGLDIWVETGRSRMQVLTRVQRLLVHELHDGVGVQVLAAQPVQTMVLVTCPPYSRSLVHAHAVRKFVSDELNTVVWRT